MLTLARVAEVEALLACGRSQRAASRETGVSRGTVAAIRHGRWGLMYRERMAARPEQTPAMAMTPARSAAVVAAARKAATHMTGESIRDLFAKHGPPELDLRPSEHARYIEVRRRLRAAGQLDAVDPEEADPRDAA